MKYEKLDALFKGMWMLIFLGARWDLLLGRSEACDSALEAKVKSTKADATLEYEEATFEVEGVDSSFDGVEGVIKLLLAIIPFLGVEDECISFLHNCDYHLKRVL